MKIALILVAAVIALVLVVLLIGAALPREHVVSRHAVLHRSADELYKVVRDFHSAPTWRPDLERVEVIPASDNRVRFREHGKNGAVTYELVEDQPDKEMVTRIVDEDLGYSGTWTYSFTKEADGIRVEITERGDVPNILFRFMSRFVFGHSATIEQYLAALSRRFGEESPPRS